MNDKAKCEYCGDTKVRTRSDGSHYSCKMCIDPVPAKDAILPQRPTLYKHPHVAGCPCWCRCPEDSSEVAEKHFTLLEQLLTLAHNHERYQFETIKVKDIIINNALIELAAWRERALIAEREL